MKVPDKDWISFGKWMMVVSGVMMISLGIYNKEDVISLILRMWVVAVGIYCFYIAFFR